jgi:hypothetical protein
VQLYNGRVRLGGSLLNEVPVYNVTAAEILVLEAMHGANNFVGIERSKDDQGNLKTRTDERAERDHLVDKFRKQLGDPPVNFAIKVLADNGFGNKLPDSVEQVTALAHLAETLARAAEDEAALERQIEERIAARAAEARAALDVGDGSNPLAPATDAAPAKNGRGKKAAAPATTDAETTRLENLGTDGQGGGAAEFG